MPQPQEAIPPTKSELVRPLLCHLSLCDTYDNLFQDSERDAMILFMWQNEITGVACLIHVLRRK
jgi:hypothetical protein